MRLATFVGAGVGLVAGRLEQVGDAERVRQLATARVLAAGLLAEQRCGGRVEAKRRHQELPRVQHAHRYRRVIAFDGD